MNFQELVTKHLVDEEKVNAFLQEMKDNKIYTAGQENMDIRYQDLQNKFNAKDLEHQEATKLIENLKKTNKDNEDIQNQISDWKTKAEKFEAENEKLKLDNAIKVGLLAKKAKADDLDYLLFKIKQDNQELKLDENGNVVGFDFDEIKISYPNNFEVESKKEVDVNNLPNINKPETSISKEAFEKMSYMDKVKLFNEDKETYDSLNK